MHNVHAIFIYKHFTFKFMALHKPTSAKDDETFELYNVVYSGNNTEDLYEFFQHRNSLKWTPYRKSIKDGKITFVVSPKISENDYEKWANDWKNDSYEDKNIYSVIQDKEFTIIVYNSTDYDSVLTKDIVLKQYNTVYNRNTVNWKTDGVISYDIITNTSDQVTFEGKNLFDLNCINDIKTKEVFLCGYDIPDLMFKQITQLSEHVFVFENNVFKINAIRSALKTNNTKLCVSKTSTKAYQAYMLLRDPIGNIKPTDNKGVEILKDYSDAVMNSFKNYSDWKHCEEVKYAFENKITDKDWKSNLVEVLFGNIANVAQITLDLESAEDKLKSESEFAQLLSDKRYLLWAGDVIALNTKCTPTFNDIKKLIQDDRTYSKIVTFYKDDDDFWTVNIYKADRDLLNSITCISALSQNHLGVQNVWYTETGIPVVKVENIRNNELVGVNWYNVSGKRPIPVNNYILDFKQGQYVFDKTAKQYVKFTKNTAGEITYDDIAPEKQENKSPLILNAKLQTYSLSGESTNITFDKVYPDLSDISFNKISLIDLLRHKYYCSGNKYVVSCSLTDKQMYDCLKTKTIMG